MYYYTLSFDLRIEEIKSSIHPSFTNYQLVKGKTISLKRDSLYREDINPSELVKRLEKKRLGDASVFF